MKVLVVSNPLTIMFLLERLSNVLRIKRDSHLSGELRSLSDGEHSGSFNSDIKWQRYIMSDLPYPIFPGTGPLVLWTEDEDL